jgi:hypothetical protein
LSLININVIHTFYSCTGIINIKTLVRYICIFHLKNAGFLHDDFWCLFLNIWTIIAILVANSSNWFLPGIYPPPYELCACISQDYSLPRKFEDFGMVMMLTTVIVWSFVTIRVKIYKRSLEGTVAPLVPSQTLPTLHTISQNKLLSDFSFPIGCLLPLTMAFSVIYIFSSSKATVNFNALKFFYFLIMPVAFNLFAILFYANNPKARTTLQRELNDSFHSWIECNQ